MNSEKAENGKENAICYYLDVFDLFVLCCINEYGCRHFVLQSTCLLWHPMQVLVLVAHIQVGNQVHQAKMRFYRS